MMLKELKKDKIELKKVKSPSNKVGDNINEQVLVNDYLDMNKRFVAYVKKNGQVPSYIVTSLENSCFQNCRGLTSVTIPSSVTSLGNSCFEYCRILPSVTIPSSVTSLGSNCFRNCNKLVDYQLYWETPPVTWSSNLMPNNTNTYFTIPNGTTANYTAKNFPSAKLVERNV